MTGVHIRKTDDDEWEYPCHDELQKKCNVECISEYIKKRRGTLRNYLVGKFGETIWNDACKTHAPAKNARKILWWNQEWISKKKTTS